jgi:hypothetical protein
MILPGLFLCVEPSSFNFEDSNGGRGNLKSDMYTMSNGDVTSLASTATAMPTPTGSGTKATATAAGAKAAATSGASVSGQGASSTAGNLKVDGMLGITLVVLGAAGALL